MLKFNTNFMLSEAAFTANHQYTVKNGKEVTLNPFC